MKRLINSALLFLSISSGLMYTSCQKDDSSENVGLATPSITGLKNIRANVLNKLTQEKVFKVSEGVTFISNKGSKVKIYPNCIVTQSNMPVTGDATLKFVEMYERGDMALSNRSLMGKNTTGDLLPLITGGQFNIEVYQGDTKLKSGCPFEVNINAEHTGGLDNMMTLWKGNVDEDDNIIWNEDAEAGQKRNINPNEATASYDIFSNQFGWTNVDKFFSDPRPKTRIKVAVPTTYNNLNSSVYLSYEGESGSLAQLDVYDMSEKFFSEHYGFVPVGIRLHVIFVSESNGSLVYATKKVTITSNSMITIAENDLAVTSNDNLKNLINNLD